MKKDYFPSAMFAETEFGSMTILPNGSDVVIEQVHVADEIIVTLRAASLTASCPLCGTLSKRVQSRYTRTLAACRREQSSSPPSRSPREHVLHGTGRVDLRLFHCRQKRGGNGGHMTWKEASVPVLRPG